MNRPPLVLVLVLLAFLSHAKADPAEESVDSKPAIEAMRVEISARPSRVLIAVEDALTMNEQAACEIVREAIASTRADAKLVGEIVFTALSHAPAMSAVIVECAVATSPHAVKEIQSAMERALGGKAGSSVTDLTGGSGKAPTEETTGKDEAASGKEATGSGKESEGTGTAIPSPPAGSDSLDFNFIGVGGIYLIPPVGSSGWCAPNDPCCTGDLSGACLRH